MRKIVLFLLLIAASVTVLPQRMQAAETAPELRCGTVTIPYRFNSPALAPRVAPPEIFDVQVRSADLQAGCAVISWGTDIPATAQVVYASADTYRGIDATKENLGLPKATVQNNAGHVAHDMIITDLEPDRTYVLYVVSRATVSGMPRVAGPFLLRMSRAPSAPAQQAVSVPQREASAFAAPATGTNATPKHTPSAAAMQPTAERHGTTEATETAAGADVAHTPATDLQAPAADEGDSVASPGADAEAGLTHVPSALSALSKSTLSPLAWIRDTLRTFIDWVRGVLRQDAAQGGDEPERAPVSQSAVSSDTEDGFVSPVLKETAPIEPEPVQAEQKSRQSQGHFSSMSDAWARMSFLLPTLVVIAFIWLTQQVILPHLNIVVERPRVFWLSSLLLFAVVAVLMQNFRLMFALLGLFLLLLGWHLLLQVIEEAQHEEEAAAADTTTAGTQEKTSPKGLSHIG